MQEGERRPAAVPALDRILDRLAADSGRHLLTGPAGEPELVSLERALSLALPPPFRALLSRLGGGIFYDRHEVFGASSLQVHDIELVPSLRTVYGRLSAPGLLPFHRGDGRVHALAMSAGGREPVAVVSLDGAHAFRSFEHFVEAVVLPPPEPGGPRA